MMPPHCIKMVWLVLRTPEFHQCLEAEVHGYVQHCKFCLDAQCSASGAGGGGDALGSGQQEFDRDVVYISLHSLCIFMQ